MYQIQMFDHATKRYQTHAERESYKEAYNLYLNYKPASKAKCLRQDPHTLSHAKFLHSRCLPGYNSLSTREARVDKMKRQMKTYADWLVKKHAGASFSIPTWDNNNKNSLARRYRKALESALWAHGLRVGYDYTWQLIDPKAD